MSNKALVRVEAKWPPYASERDKERISYGLIKAFKRAYDAAGISHQYREHEFYMKPSEKRRRKQRMQPEMWNKYENSEE